MYAILRTEEIIIKQRDQARREAEEKERLRREVIEKARAPPKPVTVPVKVPFISGEKDSKEG